MSPQLRPSIGALLLGLFIGWTGGVRWAERVCWVLVCVLCASRAWAAKWALASEWNYITGIAATAALLLGWSIGSAFASSSASCRHCGARPTDALQGD